jgi:hypothetical protein
MKQQQSMQAGVRLVVLLNPSVTTPVGSNHVRALP